MEPRHRVGGYQEFAPPPEIADFCEALWIHRTPDGPAVRGAAHRVLPDLAVSIAFQTFRDAGGRPVNGGPIVAGPKLQAHIFDLVPGRELAAIRIKPEWVAPVLGIHPLDVENSVIDLAAACPALSERLLDEASTTRSLREALGVVTRVIVRNRKSRTVPSTAAATALDLVRRSRGRLPCERLADMMGFSVRHVRRHVHDSTGVSPKAYARVVRFVSSILIADAAPSPVWADIAARAGYADQSHFIRDTIALTGRTPTDLFDERRRQVLVTAS
jgi:AraC-like DNA-binding protein